MRKLIGMFLVFAAMGCGTEITDAEGVDAKTVPAHDGGQIDRTGADTSEVLCDNDQIRVIDADGNVSCVTVGTDAGAASDAAGGNDSATSNVCGTGWFYAECPYWHGCLPIGAMCPGGGTPTNDAGHQTYDAGQQDSGNTDSTIIPTCDPGCVVVFDPSESSYQCLCFEQDAGTPDATVDCPAHSHQHGNYCVCDSGYYQVVVGNDVVCREVTSDAGSSQDASQTDAAAATCPAHSHRLDSFCICDDGYQTVVVGGHVTCQPMAGTDAGTPDSGSADAGDCPMDHATRDVNGYCYCNPGYEYSPATQNCEPEPGTTVCDNPDAIALEDNWCAIRTNDAPSSPSNGPCNGDTMCILDRHGPWSSTPDGLRETFCVFVGPMSQKVQGYPLNYHTDFPSSVDIVDLFGDYYAVLPGLIYVDQGPMSTYPTGEGRDTYVEGDYMCYDFTGKHTGEYYFNFISLYGNGLYQITVNSPPGCIIMMQNGDDYRGFCPVERTDLDKFVWLHNDLVCGTNAPAGSLEARVCQPRDGGYFVFGLRYQNTRGLDTLY